MKTIFSIILFFIVVTVYAQTNLTISGRTYTNSDDFWLGVEIPRSVKTNLVFKNNTITSVNRAGYLLLAGDETPAPTNNNLDGAVITGNKFNWSGTDMEVIPHGLFTGHNRNVIIKYNYLSHVPMGIIRKSGNNMSNSGGGIAYNIVKGGAVAMIVKGMSNVNIFNNTFYGDRTPDQTWRPLLYIYTNTDTGRYSVAHETKVFNNIFYTKHQIPAITILDEESLNGFECDYNLYWSEAGPPVFSINGVGMSFEEWQALGYDAHSVVLDPGFRDFVSFVPESRLDFGRDLGEEWSEGLATNARWSTQDPATTLQNGKWQVGAVVHDGGAVNTTTIPELTQSVIDHHAPAVIEMTFSRTLSNIVPSASAFTVRVNSVAVPLDSVIVSDNKVLLTLRAPVGNDDRVTLEYVKPSENPLQSPTGGQAKTFSPHAVINNIRSGNGSENQINIYPNPAKDFFNISNIGLDRLPQIIRIFDMSGKLRLEKYLDTEFLHRVPINLRPGIYFLHLEIGSELEHVQKLVVIE